MNPIIDHIQITAKNLKVAEHFYDKLLPFLGFDITLKPSGNYHNHQVKGQFPKPSNHLTI